MTATQLIENLAATTLLGVKIGDISIPANVNTLLTLLNMAKNKIAEDTLLWVGGETLTMVDGTSVYTLSTMPIQIIDVFDKNNVLRPRNSPDYFGYFQTSPNELTFNNISDELDIYINYYYAPSDYIISDELIVPNTLLSALQFYIAHKAYEIGKSDSDLMFSKEYYAKYANAIKDYKVNSDSSDVDTITSGINKLWLRGIR